MCIPGLTYRPPQIIHYLLRQGGIRHYVVAPASDYDSV